MNVHRRSIRLRDYDYSQNGAYFVTICTKNRAYLFGEVRNDSVFLNAAGRMILDTWGEIPQFYKGVEIGAFIVMPNHVHGIIILETVGAGSHARPSETDKTVGAGPRVRPSETDETVGAGSHARPSDTEPLPRAGTGTRPYDGRQLSLSDIVGRFKSLTTKRYIENVERQNWKRFNGKLWQTNYYEHIIRNHDDYCQIGEYITYNPQKWTDDKYFISEATQ